MLGKYIEENIRYTRDTMPYNLTHILFFNTSTHAPKAPPSIPVHNLQPSIASTRCRYWPKKTADFL
jgi:hypothetical protein